MLFAATLLFAGQSNSSNFFGPLLPFDATSAVDLAAESEPSLATSTAGSDPVPPRPEPVPPASPLTEPGILSFSSELYPAVHIPPPPSHPLSTLAFSRLPYPASVDCIARYVSSGELCSALEGRFQEGGAEQVKIDVVWTWVNGSREERMAAWRDVAAAELDTEEQSGRRSRTRRDARRAEANGRARSRMSRATGAEVYKHFREHDELRFSIRSILAAFSSSAVATLHLIVGDTPSLRVQPESTNYSGAPSFRRNAQVPHWLDVEKVSLSGQAGEAARGPPTFALHPHSSIFRKSGRPVPAGDSEGASLRHWQAVQWQRRVLPSFNSLAIESQLAHLRTSTPSVLYLNDDVFVAQNLSTSDVDSPLTGPVFRMFRGGLEVEGVLPADGNDDVEGEWRGLKYSNWLLDQRFGKRKRPYLAHHAKSDSLPILQEAYEIWTEEFEATASTRFRGRGPVELSTQFLLAHFTIEKHREALLWSYLVARFDEDKDGHHSVDERTALLSHLLTDVDFDNDTLILWAPMPRRSTLSSLAADRAFAGILDPKETQFEYSSMDGYAHFAADDAHSFAIPKWSGWPSFADGQDNGDGAPCTLAFSTCFGDEFLALKAESPPSSAIETFRRIAFEHPECGDCLIVLLLAKSGNKGLEAFLPPEYEGERERRSEGGLGVELVGQKGKRWQDVEFETANSGQSARQQ
ncbi:hypothetical protein JCM5296_000733, partial [Sporobolomyces johnsonii]